MTSQGDTIIVCAKVDTAAIEVTQLPLRKKVKQHF